MPVPKVFVSSTCKDLANIRESVRQLIISMGYTPIMSDFDEVFYDPNIHTHASCIREVSNSDMVIFIIGGRFGGEITSEGLIELESNSINSIPIKDKKKKISITQAEILNAIQHSKPIYTFVEERVYNDAHLYQKNLKLNPNIVEKIYYPSIDNNDYAKYIFDLIQYIRQRTYNNAIKPFKTFREIEDYLIIQWASLFGNYLRENNLYKVEQNNFNRVLSEIDSLKTLQLTQINDVYQKKLINDSLKFKNLIDFFTIIGIHNIYEYESYDQAFIENNIVYVILVEEMHTKYKFNDDENIFSIHIVSDNKEHMEEKVIIVDKPLLFSKSEFIFFSIDDNEYKRELVNLIASNLTTKSFITKTKKTIDSFRFDIYQDCIFKILYRKSQEVNS